ARELPAATSQRAALTWSSTMIHDTAALSTTVPSASVGAKLLKSLTWLPSRRDGCRLVAAKNRRCCQKLTSHGQLPVYHAPICHSSLDRASVPPSMIPVAWVASAT